MVVEKAREIVSDIVHRRIRGVDGTVDAKLAGKLMTICFTFRLYTIGTKGLLEKLWEEVRSDVAFTDFLLTSTVELKLRLTAAERTELNDAIVAAYGHPNDDATVVDHDTLARLPTKESEFKNILKANPWFAFLIILETLELMPAKGTR